ncbi:hypothetical protein [Methylobacter tundripaludum]|uniref:hypothetical protein n=1 Tax=Methylobacter tundripaludum TaxID=173365 RepID=UPI0004DF47C2|nr:hypothetical protein [Methylobacter tundripaludum]
MVIGKRVKRLIYKNRVGYALSLVIAWPLAIFFVFLTAVSNAADSFLDEFLYTWEQMFFWPCFTKEHFEAKRKKFGIDKSCR